MRAPLSEIAVLALGLDVPGRGDRWTTPSVVHAITRIGTGHSDAAAVVSDVASGVPGGLRMSTPRTLRGCAHADTRSRITRALTCT